jgi:hypothetical protein
MTPQKVSAQRLLAGAPHRAQLPAGYNSYSRVNGEAGYSAAMDNERMLLWPLFVTSFCLWDSLQHNNWHGAEQVIIVSASSKTSLGLAYALKDDDTSPKVIGITSDRNLTLVNDLNLYDQTLTYQDMAALDSSLTTVIVDMSGNQQVLGQLSDQLGDRLNYCIRVGLTHSQDTGANDGSQNSQGEFFFAPAHIQMRIRDWGVAGFEQKSAAFIMQTVAKTRDWLKLKKVAGLEGLSSVYDDVCDGKVAPDEGIIIEL